MLNAKVKKAFKGFKILKKQEINHDILWYWLADKYDHEIDLKIKLPADNRIVEFLDSLGYWEVIK